MLKKWLQRVLGIENIKELIYIQNNNILAHDRSSEKLMREYEKDNIKLSQMLENAKTVLIAKEEQIELQNNMILEKDSEIQRLTQLLEEKEKESQKHSEFVRKTTERLLENQEKKLNQKKPTLVDLKIEKMNKISESAKAKLK